MREIEPKKIIVDNATTGDNIAIIDFCCYSAHTIGEMIADIYFNHKLSGIIIKTGYEP